MPGKTKPPPGARVRWGHPLAARLVGAYEFLERGSTALYDLITNDKYAFANTAPFWQGNSVRFDGSSNCYAETLTGPTLANSPFSIVFEMSNGSFNASAGGWLSVGNGGSTRNLIHIRGQNSTTLRFAMFSDDLDATVPDMTNQRLHIVCTLDDQFTQKIYLNGQFMNSRTAGGFFAGNRICWFGKGSSNTVLACNIFYARFYRKALTQTEILQLYSDPYAILTAPKKYWDTRLGTAYSQTIDAGMSQFAGTLSETAALNQTLNAGMSSFAGSLSPGGAYSETLNASMAAFAGSLAAPSNLSVVLDQNMPLFNATLRATIAPPAPTHCEAVPVQSSAVPLAFLIEPDERAGS